MPKRAIFERSRRELSLDVSVGVHIIFVVEQSSLENQSRGCAKTPILTVVAPCYTGNLVSPRPPSGVFCFFAFCSFIFSRVMLSIPFSLSSSYLSTARPIPTRQPALQRPPISVVLQYIQNLQYRGSGAFFFSFWREFILSVSHLRPMGLNVLGYQSHLLQRCHPACGHYGYSHLSPVLAYVFLSRCEIQPLVDEL